MDKETKNKIADKLGNAIMAIQSLSNRCSHLTRSQHLELSDVCNSIFEVIEIIDRHKEFIAEITLKSMKGNYNGPKNRKNIKRH